LRLTLMSLIVGNSFIIGNSFTVKNSFKFTTLVRISADAIRMVYEMRPCADILSRDPPDGIRMASGEHWYKIGPFGNLDLVSPYPSLKGHYLF
jgi:hypothetical protein